MDYKFTDIFNTEELKELCESFTQLNDTTLAILDLEGNIIVATGWQPICVQFHRINKETCKRCLESDTTIASQLNDGEKYTMYTCKNGLVDVAMPITVNNEHVGNFFMGQFFLKSPDIVFFKDQSKRFGFEEKSYLDALKKVPLFNEEEVKRTVSFLVQITEILGNIGFKSLQNIEYVKQLERDKQKLNKANIQYSKLNEDYIAQYKDLQIKENQLEEINTNLELLVELRTDELKESISQLTESNAAKEKLFRIIGHDLRSPISQMIQLSEIFEEEFFNISEEEKMNLIKDLKASSTRGFELFENLLEWSRSQTGAIQFKPANVSIHTIVKEIIELLKKEAANKNIQIHNNIDCNSTIWADRDMINTVLRNLISNAIKFTYPNGKVEISHKIHSGNHEITIKDNGKGMTNEEQGQLFKIQSGFSTMGTNEEKGTGLGLIICKEFIEKHKGKILINSEKDKGSEFVICLPIF